MENLENYSEQTFESIKHVNEYGQEFWYARDLQVALKYGKWENFQNVLSKAKSACEQAGNNISDHFADARKMIDLAKGAHREIEDYMLSRYACYLIVMNGDSRKKEPLARLRLKRVILDKEIIS